MKTLELNQMEVHLAGQVDPAACGGAVAAAIIFPGPWTLLVAVAFCVSDSE